MRFLCSGCERLVDAAAAHVVADGVRIDCPKCGAAELIKVAAEPEPPDEEAPARVLDAADASADDTTCPKCGTARPAGEACPRCGLARAGWQPETDRGAPPAHIAALWEEVEDRWDEAQVHDRFVAECRSAGALSFAAHCYSSRSDARARTQTERIAVLAMDALRASEASSARPGLGRVVGWLAVALVFGGLVVAMLAMLLRAP
jgi:ribosomal protein L32/DNA-directed RNA polymerase subunit RPC12/RpoP